MIRVLALLALLGVLPGVAAAQAGDDAGSWSWHGRLEASSRYNSNLSLLSDAAPMPVKKSWLTELGGRLDAGGTLAGWTIEAQATGLTDLHVNHTEENWRFGRGRIALRHPGLGGTIELADESRYYTVPGRPTFDFARSTAFLGWRRRLGPRLQLRSGYEGILTRYPKSPNFDYTVHGLLAELRTRWGAGLTTHVAVDLQSYNGEATPQDADAEASPEDGRRWSGRLGFDWVHGRHVLSGTYSLQEDEANLGVQQIGDIEGPDDQDIDAEFDLAKHKTTLLYSVPLSHRWLLSSYGEWIHKVFDDEERRQQVLPKRTDDLLLCATHLRLRLDDRWSLKLRYLYRANHSSIALLEYDDHIFSAGFEFRPH